MTLGAVSFFAGILSLASAAVLQAPRQLTSIQSDPNLATCPIVTSYSYITVTVTHIPNVVTIAVPDYSSISKSLASASTIDSIVVVENSQDRPVSAPPDTRIPTFVNSINAPAFEATEAPNNGNSIFYVSATASPANIVIGTTTQSIILSPPHAATTVPSNGQLLPAGNGSPLQANFTAPQSGWNGTQVNATGFPSAYSTSYASNVNSTSTVTHTSYVNTTTVVAATTATVTTYQPYGGYTGVGNMVKRQTCVLISAQIGGQWASWCNNWDGSTVVTYTSWQTTVTPGAGPEQTSSLASTSVLSTISSTSTSSVTAPPATTTQTIEQTPTDTGVAPSTPSPTCGQTGAFNISFDNLPEQSVFDNETAGLPPIFNPFDHFYWSNGWSYAPPPAEPYAAHDGTHLAIYVPTNVNNLNDQVSDNSEIPEGGFGAGPRSQINAYWFSAQSAWFGCDNSSTDPSNVCDFVAEGYRYDDSTNSNKIAVTEHFSQPLCHSATCQLSQIFFSDSFVNLTTISFYAKIGGYVRTFYMDDIHMTWSNNSCEAGNLRVSSRK